MSQPRTTSPWTTLLATALGGLVAGVTLFTVQVAADQDAATDQVPRQIPYNGTLELDGTAVNATGDDALWMRFDITDGNTIGAPVVYSQSMQVNVFNGSFTALIGPIADDGTDIQDVIAHADDVYMTLHVLRDHNPDDPASTAADDLQLSNAQRLTLSPITVWATNATDFDVANSLTVEGAATFDQLDTAADVIATGDVSSADAFHTDNVVADGLPIEDLNDFRLLFYEDATPGRSYGLGVQPSTLFYNSNNTIKFMRIGANNMFITTPTGSGFEVNLNVGEDLTIADDLFMTAALTASSNTLTIDDALSISGNLGATGNLAHSGSTLTAANGLTVGGNVTLGGTITDSNSGVNIGEAMTVNGNMTVNGLLSSNKFNADNDQSDGCMRMNAIQICWGRVAGGNGTVTTSFRRGFANSSYALVINPITSSGNKRFFTVNTRSNGSFTSKAFQASGSDSSVDGMYVAIGRATW